MKDLIKRLLDAGKLDAGTAEDLNGGFDEFEAKLKTARDESIDRRKKVKDLEADIAEITKSRDLILEALGIDPADEFNPADLAEKAKGKTEADKQLELKLKRLEKDLEKANSDRDGALGKLKDSQKQIALTNALAKHDWIDTEIVTKLLSSDIEVTDDGVFMADGVTLDDGVAQFAAQKPHLLKAQGQGGSGYQKPGDKGQKNPFAKETRNLTEQARLLKENPKLAAQLKAQAI